MSKRDEDQRLRRGEQADDAGEEWTEEGGLEWDEDEPIMPAKPKESPPWLTWVAGLVGLLIGLLLFRSC